MSNRANAAAGGSGAGYQALVKISEYGTYTVSVGSGGLYTCIVWQECNRGCRRG